MTLAIAWTRKLNTCEELIVASDSRLSGGMIIDCCQKILALPRTDAFICFAGDTHFAYPLMQQAYSAINSYRRAQDRSLDLHDLRGHILKIFNQLATSVTSLVRGRSAKQATTPDAMFMFGGYSWIRKHFSVWIIKYDDNLKRFIYETPKKTKGGAMFAIAGDEDLRREAKKRLMLRLRQRGVSLSNNETFGFDWEPFEILRDMLRENDQTYPSIGGAPQVMKIYQHMNCRPLGVYWPNRDSNQIYISGRKLLGIEKPDMWILDPDTKITSHPYFTDKEETETI